MKASTTSNGSRSRHGPGRPRTEALGNDDEDETGNENDGGKRRIDRRGSEDDAREDKGRHRPRDPRQVVGNVEVSPLRRPRTSSRLSAVASSLTSMATSPSRPMAMSSTITFMFRASFVRRCRGAAGFAGSARRPRPILEVDSTRATTRQSVRPCLVADRLAPVSSTYGPEACHRPWSIRRRG